ncbi:PTS sugar transporter subunit IIA [Streptomyces sp. YIM S03343]
MNAAFNSDRRAAVLSESMQRLFRWGLVSSVSVAESAVVAREGAGSTYVGKGIAVPHVVGSAALKSAVGAIECEECQWGAHRVTLLLFVTLPELGLPQEERQTAVIRDIAQLTRRIPSAGEAANAVFEFLREHGAYTETCETDGPGRGTAVPLLGRGGYLEFEWPSGPITGREARSGRTLHE